MTYSTLLLSEITDQDAVGGKARGLAALLAAGFAVPEGFVLSPEATPEEIIAAYRRLGTPGVAVRSSAAAEDSNRLSYAGQFETFLSISDDAALLRAVEACRASVWTTRGANYFEYPDPAASRMYVIVQRMITPEYAGVAFADANGETAVEGVAGLGDRLVSGKAGPSVLPEDLRGAVERTARAAVERLGGALDIEWAAERGCIWLLQARPITAPLQAALPDRFRLWTAANFQEAIPRPLTPISEEVARDSIREVFRISFHFSGLPEPDGPIERLVKGRFYMSYSAVASSMSVLPGFRMENLLRMFGDGPDLAPFVAYRQGRRLSFLVTLPATVLRYAGWILFATGRIRDVRESVRVFDDSVRSAIASGANDTDLLGILQATPSFMRPAATAMSISSSMANGLLNTMMYLASEHMPEVPSAEVASMARTGGLESLEPSRQLAAFADWLRENPARPDDDPEVETCLRRFLDACGSRCENEAELAKPRWREQPHEVLRLARHLASTSPGPTRPPAPDMPRRVLLHLVLSLYARPARIWQRRRETTRALLAGTAESCRHLLLEIGRRLRTRNVLDAPEDVFFLLRDEVASLLETPSSPAQRGTMAARVGRRRELYRRMLDWPPPPRLLAELPDGRLVPFVAEPGSGTVLRGFGASPGRVTARARVLLEIGQAKDLQPGEILVARTTDIGWTLVFRLASAVVTEIGAPTSHTAIVARELGLPAVVNVDRATERIRTGDELFVDGWAGVVRRNPPQE
jgi:pyruvate,water dikinase